MTNEAKAAEMEVRVVITVARTNPAVTDDQRRAALEHELVSLPQTVLTLPWKHLGDQDRLDAGMIVAVRVEQSEQP
jgi:hypothetical protein